MANRNCNTKITCSPETLVFGEEGFDFRIPALLYVKEWSTFLAFAEKRASEKDEDAKYLVMKKGTRQPDGSVQWSPKKVLKEAKKKGYRTMNPCPIFERNSRKLFLFFICLRGETPEWELKPGDTHLGYVTSTDCGDTWSDLTNLTDVIVKAFPDYKTFAVGPGHGIQLGCGTLLVPAYVREVKCCRGGLGCRGWLGCRGGLGCWCCWCSAGCSGCETTHSVALRRQDQQAAWQAGQHISLESGECQLAEVCDMEGVRKVYMNARSTEEYRVEALSDDGGLSFQRLRDLTLRESPKGCQGSVLGFPATELPGVRAGSSGTALLFSHPTAGEGYNRLDLGLYLSRSLQDQPPWDTPSIIHQGRSGYSDLTHCEEDGHFACLMEGSTGERHQIMFREFHLTVCKDCVAIG